MPLPRSSPCRKRLFSCQGTGEKNLSSGRHRESRKLEHFWKEIFSSSGRHWRSRFFSLCLRNFFSSCGRHRDGSKLNTQRKIFSLCAQWARIFDSTCGPVGQKFHPLGWKLLSHIPNFRGVKVNPHEKKLWHHWCRSCGSHRSPGRRSSQVVGNEMPQKTTPYDIKFSLCDHWSGSRH